MFITQSFKKSLIVEQFQGNYLKAEVLCFCLAGHSHTRILGDQYR